MRISLRRAYDPRDDTNGTHVLVERLWPRGLTKDRADVDQWLKDIAPSPALRKWYGHNPEKWPEFRRRYRRELTDNDEAVQALAQLAAEGPLTLVFGSRERIQNSANVLKDYLESRGK